MIDTITRYMVGIGDHLTRRSVYVPLSGIGDRLSCVALSTAGLVITGGGGTTAKVGATDFYATVKGVIVKKAAATAMPALSGTVANATFNVFTFFVDSAGVVTSAMGTAGSTLALVKFAPIPVGQTIVGHIVINPTGTGSFVGGTTALDDGTVVPTAAYISPVGASDPTILL